MANLPMPMNPLESFSKGFHMTDNLMNQLLQRKQLAEQHQQFLEELALKKQQLAKSGANSDLTRAIMQQQLLGLQHQNDPNYEANQYAALEDFWKNRGNQGVQSVGKQIMPEEQSEESIPQQQFKMPTEEAGQGLGMFNQAGLSQAQSDEINRQQQAQQNQQMGQSMAPQMPQLQQPTIQQPSQPTSNAGGLDLELMKKHPMLRGWYKKHFGVDPLAAVPQTPEEKLNAQLELFKQKEKYKSEQEQKLPAAIKTLHENIIHLSPKAHKAIQHIIDIPSPLEPWGMGAIKSGQKAAHNKAVTAAAENYAKAKGWPNTRGSIDKAESILQRGNFETDFDYHKRLKELQDELEEGMQSSQQFLHPNKKLENTGNTTKTKKTVDWSKYPVGG